jgi:hypothetical protein
MFIFFTEGYPCRLSDIFEIRQGIAAPYMKHKVIPKTDHIYKLIYPADLNMVFKTLNIDSLSDFHSEKELNQAKLLTEEDYLISCKGIVKGFSLLYSADKLASGPRKARKAVVATNQFIIMRPRPNFQEVYGLPYLHNLLDLLIPKMNQMTETRSEKSVLRYITISDIENITLELPVQKAEIKRKEFDTIYKSWKKNLELFSKSDEQLKAYNDKTIDQFKIQLPELSKRK